MPRTIERHTSGSAIGAALSAPAVTSAASPAPGRGVPPWPPWAGRFWGPLEVVSQDGGHTGLAEELGRALEQADAHDAGHGARRHGELGAGAVKLGQGAPGPVREAHTGGRRAHAVTGPLEQRHAELVFQRPD